MKEIVVDRQVELVEIDTLIPYAGNARTHSKEQIDELVALIKRYGWTQPMLVDSDGIIAGHGRLAAARRLNLSKVPVIRLDGLTEAERKALILADNKVALNAGWNEELLAIELADLADQGFDMSLTGFSQNELDSLLIGDEADLPEDEAPELPYTAASKSGETWILGRHRVRCGDSTRVADVSAVLGEVQPHLMVTDPPYGVEYDPNWRNEAARHSDGMGNRGLGAGAVGKVQNDDIADWTETWKLFPGDVAYIWHAGKFASVVADSLEKASFEIRSQIIWRKSRFVISRGDYHWQHEPCWYAVRKGTKAHWQGARDQSTVWDIDHVKSETGHGTQKPIQAMARPIENNSSPGQAVYDPFLGSGTTLIACEQMGRQCLGLEIDPRYVDVIIRRWQDLTGEHAILEGTKQTFNQIASKRLKDSKPPEDS